MVPLKVISLPVGIINGDSKGVNRIGTDLILTNPSGLFIETVKTLLVHTVETVIILHVQAGHARSRLLPALSLNEMLI